MYSRRTGLFVTALTVLVLALGGGLAVGPSSAAPDSHDGSDSVATQTYRQVKKGIKLRTGINPHPIVSGNRVAFFGTAPGTLKRVVLKRRVGNEGKWVTVAKTSVRDRRYEIRGVATGVGVNKWKVTGNAQVKTKKGKRKVTYRSNVVNTTVFRWFYFHDLQEVETDLSWDGPQVATIAGRTYSRSVGTSQLRYTGSDGWADYSLNGRCTRLKTIVGLDDDSATAAQVDAYISLDGERELVAGNIGLADTSVIDFDITSRLRVRLEGVNVLNDIRAYVSFGNARVLCRAAP